MVAPNNIVPAWPFKVDWTNGYTETLEWKTSVLGSPIGAEQRYAARMTPRRKLDLPFLVSGGERTYFDLMMMANSGSNWYAPLAHDATYVRAVYPLTPGPGVKVFCDTALREYRVGGHVILQGGSVEQWDVLTIAAVGWGGLTTVETPELNAYGRGSTMYPAVLARITDTLTAKRQHGRVLSGTMQFLCMEPTIWPINGNTLAAVPFYTYQPEEGAMSQGPWPILTMEPNAVDALDYSYARKLAVNDNEVSLPTYEDQANRAFTGQQYTWFLAGRQAGSNFRDLLFTLDGQRVPLWVPTFNDDVTPGSEYYPNPNLRTDNPSGRDTLITFNVDGTFSVNPGLADIIGTDGLPVNFSSPTAVRTSFMNLKRLNQDSVEIMHHSDADGVATVTVVLIDAPDLRVPTPYNSFVYTDTGQLQPDGSTITATNTTNTLTTPVTITSVGGVPQ